MKFTVFCLCFLTFCDSVMLRYVTYVPGNCNIILASPHGGFDVLDNAPVRQNGCYDGKECEWTQDCSSPRSKQKCRASIYQDFYTRPIAEQLGAKIQEISGKMPHVIHMDVHRKYVDVNRPKDQGTGGHPIAEAAWDDFHNTVQQVRASLEGNGIYFDIHGQRHPHGLVELGYRVSKSDLNSHNFSASDTSIRNLACRQKVDNTLADLIWGAKSFGGILQSRSIRCVPSPEHETPGGMKYYRGGYNTEQYGSRLGGAVDAIQLELPRWARNADNATVIVQALAETIVEFTNLYY